MIFSLLVLTFFIIIQFFSDRQNFYITSRIRKKVKLLIFVVSFMLIELLRRYGQSKFGDIPNYKYIFNDVHSLFYLLQNNYSIDYFYTNVELGFLFLISLFKCFSNNFDFFLFFISLLQLSVFYFFCKKSNIKFFNALPIYVAMIFITFQIGMLRQSLGFLFFLLALVNHDKKLIFLLLIIVGCTFHISTAFCILFIFSNISINKKIYLFLFLISILIYIMKIDLVSGLSYYIELIELGNAGRVDYYLNEVDRANNYLGIGFWERVLYFILLYKIFNKKLFKNVNYQNLIFNIAFFSILFQIVFFASPTITSRLRYFVVIFPALIIAQFIYYEYRKGFKPIFQIIFSAYLVMYMFFLTTYLD